MAVSSCWCYARFLLPENASLAHACHALNRILKKPYTSYNRLMPYTARFQHHIRSYELDIYAHVNNAVYLQWFEHGRSQMLQDKGLDYLSIVQAWNVRLVTVSTHIDFVAQLHLDDLVEVRTTVAKMGRSSVTYAQEVVRIEKSGDTTTAARGQSVICFTDPDMQGSTPIPEEFRKLYG